MDFFETIWRSSFLFMNKKNGFHNRTFTVGMGPCRKKIPPEPLRNLILVLAEATRLPYTDGAFFAAMSAYLQASVLSNQSIGEQVRHLIITGDALPAYEPGQFFLLRMRDAKGELVERSYSAANWGVSDRLELVVRIESKGHMSGLIDSLEVGDHVDLKGPFGRFGLQSLEDPAQRLVFIAGGVGLSPLRSMLQKAAGEGFPVPIQLFYGFRSFCLS